MTSLKAKILQTFKNLKADAVPRPPRTNDELEAENPPLQTPPEPEPEKKEKKKNGFFPHSKKKKKDSLGNDSDPRKTTSESIINTQAAGNVINIVNSHDFHWGNEYVYYMGTPNGSHKEKKSGSFDENVEKDNLITLLMESTSKPDHVYIDYISKNLGRNWHDFFRSLGFTIGRIETMEIDEARNGVSEARYKLLLDWIRNDDDGSLGKLATLLWEEGERQIVKDLALMYRNRKET